MGTLREKFVFTLSIIIFLAGAGFGGNAEIKPLPFKLPPPMYRGTPPSLGKVVNLEPLPKRVRPAFYAPGDVTNVALNKPVSSSEDMPIIGELELITDGDKNAVDGSFVELGLFLQDVTIDLEGEYEVYAILVWHFHARARVFYDVVVQVGDDADFIENVRTVFNNDLDNSSGMGIGEDKHYVETNRGRLIDVKGQVARYVRLYSQGNQENGQNQYIEVEVWGRPVGKAKKEAAESEKSLHDFVRLEVDYPKRLFIGESWHLQNYTGYEVERYKPVLPFVPEGTKNVAIGAKVVSSNPEPPIIGHLEMITDGNAQGVESSMVETGPGPGYITVDLGESYELHAIIIWRDHPYFQVYRDVVVEVAGERGFEDGVTLFNNDCDDTLGMGRGYDPEYLESHFVRLIHCGGRQIRYIRVHSNGKVSSKYNILVEIAAYGIPSADSIKPAPVDFEFPKPEFK